MTHGLDYHALFAMMIAISTTMAHTSRPRTRWARGHIQAPNPSLISLLGQNTGYMN
jgi:hypothetical protein